jgi:hypothetical protein
VALKTAGLIYFLGTKEAPQRVKIGFTQLLAARLEGIEGNALGHRLYLFGLAYGTRIDERGLHAKFRGHSIFREWFWFRDDVRQWINDNAFWKSADGVHVSSPEIAMIETLPESKEVKSSGYVRHAQCENENRMQRVSVGLLEQGFGFDHISRVVRLPRHRVSTLVDRAFSKLITTD